MGHAVTLAALIAAATVAAMPADAGDYDVSARSRELSTVRPLYPGASTYELRDRAGRLSGTAKPLYPGSDTLQLRDRAGRLQGSVETSPNTGRSFVPRRNDWGRVDPLDRR